MIPVFVGVQALAVFVGVVYTLFTAVGLALAPTYGTETAGRRAENVRFAIITVAEEHVRDALVGTIEHTVDAFPEYEVTVVCDEGAHLEAELRAREDVATVVVPESYDCAAEAKGRAIQYFLEAVVTDAPEYWYAFLDDDNRVLDDRFLREIPVYEQRGYGAMNPVLVPRRGRSLLTFVADHVRYVDDVGIFRLFTGLLGRPYMGFHGELLCARGDVLAEIGFDRASIVEDFAFALELIRAEVPVWQSGTRVSVLSPHDVTSFLRQRARWYWGIATYLPRAPVLSQVIVGVRIAAWTVAIAASWLLVPLWLLGYGVALPAWLTAIVQFGAVLYVGTVLVGTSRVGGASAVLLLALVPVYALLEQVAPLYALWHRQGEFVVIDK